MSSPTGLRERKRERTREAISSAAISLFLARGFDPVSVAEIAAAAEVSKPTLFKYFGSKEDLVLHRIADHEAEAAGVLRSRSADEHPVDTLHRHFRSGLSRRDPVTGLNDHPEVLAFHGMVFGTPSLLARLARYAERDEEALAAAWQEPPGGTDPLTARLAAAQVVAIQRVLARRNWQRLVDGASADATYPVAVQEADRAFGLLRAVLATEAVVAGQAPCRLPAGPVSG
ncbi:TetR family transcriptional regulator [Micromonospora sp. CPCC 206060]|uniref:TetR/AcrR family transcriptional regulator n=1 Tax=Micromonospora sp. CPCC 206060 TaxID=3122406 RepID=UPI002FF1A2E8